MFLREEKYSSIGCILLISIQRHCRTQELHTKKMINAMLINLELSQNSRVINLLANHKLNVIEMKVSMSIGVNNYDILWQPKKLQEEDKCEMACLDMFIKDILPFKQQVSNGVIFIKYRILWIYKKKPNTRSIYTTYLG